MTPTILSADPLRTASVGDRREVTLANGRVVEIRVENGSVTLSPDLPLAELRGFLGKMRPGGLREKHERR